MSPSGPEVVGTPVGAGAGSGLAVAGRVGSGVPGSATSGPRPSAPAASTPGTPTSPEGSLPARLRAMSSTELKECFKRALEFVRPFLSMSTSELAATAGPAAALALGDADKLRFYGYFKQATKGDQPLGLPLPPDEVERAKLEAWSTVRGVSRKDAMRAFVFLLDRALATWDSAASPSTSGTSTGGRPGVTPGLGPAGHAATTPGAASTPGSVTTPSLS